MKAQLLVCDDITFNPDKQTHELGSIINRLYVPTLPYVQSVSILIKLYDIPHNEMIDCGVLIQDDENAIIGYSTQFALRNYRAADEVPGVDAHLQIPMVISLTGQVRVQLIVNGELQFNYPITIRLGSYA